MCLYEMLIVSVTNGCQNGLIEYLLLKYLSIHSSIVGRLGGIIRRDPQGCCSDTIEMGLWGSTRQIALSS